MKKGILITLVVLCLTLPSCLGAKVRIGSEGLSITLSAVTPDVIKSTILKRVGR